MKEFLHILSLGETLSQEQAEAAMHLMMRGEAEPVHAAG
ncbi:MAG: anthranilate phosphoribosyltransferase, partial [Rhodothermales bacterium]